MRKMMMVFVGVLWIAAGIQLIKNMNQEDEEQIVQAFQQTNCLATECKLTAEMKLGEYRTRIGQEQMLQDIAAGLGIHGSVDMTSQTEDGKTVVRLSREASQAQITMDVLTTEEEVEGMVESEQYFRAQIVLYDNLECAFYYKEDLERALSSYGENAQTGIQFYGELAGKLSDEKRDMIIEQMFDKISANVCRSFKTENVYTVYAYTDGLDEYRRINGEKVNVTAAVTYHEEDDKTCFYLAMPVIKEDY